MPVHKKIALSGENANRVVVGVPATVEHSCDPFRVGCAQACLSGNKASCQCYLDLCWEVVVVVIIRLVALVLPFLFSWMMITFSRIRSPFSLCGDFYNLLQPAQKSFRTKRTLAKKQRQNRPLPHWIRLRTDNTIKWNAKRRHWRRTKLGL